MSRARLIEIARDKLAHGRAGTIEKAEDLMKIPVEHYYDAERYKQEVDRIFRRLPLLLATTAELPEVGSYKAIDVVGTQVLITRTKSGEIRAFVNMCSHRGARLVEDGRGTAFKFTCPYHAWTYSPDGDLVAVFAADDFGDIDKSCYGLTALPCLEKAGLVWVTLNPDSSLDMELFLSGYDELLAEFGFENWHFEHSQRVEGPNWKVAYDGYLDYYHLPVLHRESFGSDIGHRPNYYSWGPHTHMSHPTATFAEFEDLPDEDWPITDLVSGVWTIFPHVSIASFFGGGRSVMISQLFPGETPDTSFTIQTFLMEKAPETAEIKQEAAEQFEFLKHVVRDEDYATGIALQKNLSTGARDHVLFGRNEGGGQRFHRWVDTLLETPDEDLPKLFQTG